ncbi:hypothetical protein GW17_00046123 [Ensete ventricosum]|nr:hypothetical protein GW17_00046123 [Ensete ventricosum]
MASHIVGYPRMGPKRELKFALESFWDGKNSADDLQKVATDLRCSIWKQMADAGIKYIPSNTFSYYDQVLDTTAMLGAVPERYNYTVRILNKRLVHFVLFSSSSFCTFCTYGITLHREVTAELKAAGASWIQFDEPTLVMDLESHQLEAFTKAYTELESSLSGLNVLIETYFADVPAEAYK